MRYYWILTVICLLLAGCHSTPQTAESTEPTTQTLMLGNPWRDYITLAEAEAACGLDFPLEETVSSSYHAESFRVLNGELMEVTYRDDSFTVTVRMQAGEGLDLSGVYMEFEEVSTFTQENYTLTNKHIKDGGILQLISRDGFSYSFYAPNHYWGDSNADFLAFLNQ